MAFTPYVTDDEFKAWVTLNDSIDDIEIAGVTATVTRWIDEYCQRHFWQDGTLASPVARTFVTRSRWCLDLGPFNDLTAVVAPVVKTDEAGDGTFETTWAASDFELHPVSRPTGRPYTSVDAIAGRLFPVRSGTTGRSDRVEITGVWGWPAVPDEVPQACLIQGSRILKRRYSPEGVAGFGEFGAVRVSGRLDPDVQQLLDPYRRVAVLVA